MLGTCPLQQCPLGGLQSPSLGSRAQNPTPGHGMGTFQTLHSLTPHSSSCPLMHWALLRATAVAVSSAGCDLRWVAVLSLSLSALEPLGLRSTHGWARLWHTLGQCMWAAPSHSQQSSQMPGECRLAPLTALPLSVKRTHTPAASCPRSEDAGTDPRPSCPGTVSLQPGGPAVLPVGWWLPPFL